jgi:hypothetical protein
MSTVLTEDGNPLTIELRGDATARLFGAPFLLIGGYLAYQLAGGVLDLLTGRAAVGEMLVGTMLLTIVTAAFLIPGWLLIFSRARIEIDRTARTVAYVRDLRVYQHRQQRALAEFDRIEVDLLSVAPNRRSRSRAYQVELAGSRPGKITVGLFDDDEQALTFGHRLGALVGLPVTDLSTTERDEDDR